MSPPTLMPVSTSTRPAITRGVGSSCAETQRRSLAVEGRRRDSRSRRPAAAPPSEPVTARSQPARTPSRLSTDRAESSRPTRVAVKVSSPSVPLTSPPAIAQLKRRANPRHRPLARQPAGRLTADRGNDRSTAGARARPGPQASVAGARRDGLYGETLGRAAGHGLQADVGPSRLERPAPGDDRLG